MHHGVSVPAQQPTPQAVTPTPLSTARPPATAERRVRLAGHSADLTHLTSPEVRPPGHSLHHVTA